MSPSERGIVFTNDLDGVHFKSPPPVRALLRLVRKDTELPELGRPVGEFKLPKGLRAVLGSRWSILFHQARPVDRSALAALGKFKRVAEEHNRDFKIAALSGREPDKHQMTREKLQTSGHMEFFSDLFLNEGKSATAWKEEVVQRILDQGLSVVHIDDDLRSGLCIARMGGTKPNDPRVLVYVLRNVSNHPRLIKRAGISLPQNLVLVSSFLEAALDFSNKLQEGKF